MTDNTRFWMIRRRRTYGRGGGKHAHVIYSSFSHTGFQSDGAGSLEEPLEDKNLLHTPEARMPLRDDHTGNGRVRLHRLALSVRPAGARQEFVGCINHSMILYHTMEG